MPAQGTQQPETIADLVKRLKKLNELRRSGRDARLAFRDESQGRGLHYSIRFVPAGAEIDDADRKRTPSAKSVGSG